ncbi:MAG: transketolase [Thermoplasmata archaeon]
MGLDQALIHELEERARVLRVHVVRMTHAAGSGHPGGSLSAADVIAALYFHILRLDPKDPSWADRDRFVLSKGHGCPVLYAALAERGFFPVKELMTLRQLGGRLQGHPEYGTTPGVEAPAGAEGHGLSISIGMALAGRLDGRDYHVYTMVGDGENDVGQTWEAAMAAANFKLDNLTAILDRNQLQQERRTEDIMPLEPLAEKWKAFGWNVLEIDGHDMASILGALYDARTVHDRPTMIIAQTVKGKGVSFMENVLRFHGTAPTEEELARALKELGEAS